MPDLVSRDDQIRHERLRIARDLHDTVAQRLAAMGYSLDAIIGDERIPSDRKRDLRSARLELGNVVRELRDEIVALRDESSSTIETWLRARISMEISWRRVHTLDLPLHLLDELRHLLLELLRNAHQHAGVESVTIEEQKSRISAHYGISRRSNWNPKDQGNRRESISLGRVGILERITELNARLDETEVGFELLWR